MSIAGANHQPVMMPDGEVAPEVGEYIEILDAQISERPAAYLRIVSELGRAAGLPPEMVPCDETCEASDAERQLVGNYLDERRDRLVVYDGVTESFLRKDESHIALMAALRQSDRPVLVHPYGSKSKVKLEPSGEAGQSQRRLSVYRLWFYINQVAISRNLLAEAVDAVPA